MPATDINEYCSFTKAVEHIGERWSLLILRELIAAGPQSFTSLAHGLPGHVSRSVLSDRLRRLQSIGLIARSDGTDGGTPYHLTDAGRAFIPTLQALRGWADSWLPDDPSLADRDPDIIFAWLIDRIDRSALPERSLVLDIRMQLDDDRRCWIVLERGLEPYGCFEDPLLDESRYVYLSASRSVLFSIARGRRALADAIRDGSVVADGDPAFVRAAPEWFDASPMREAASA